MDVFRKVGFALGEIGGVVIGEFDRDDFLGPGGVIAELEGVALHDLGGEFLGESPATKLDSGGDEVGRGDKKERGEGD